MPDTDEPNTDKPGSRQRFRAGHEHVEYRDHGGADDRTYGAQGGETVPLHEPPETRGRAAADNQGLGTAADRSGMDVDGSGGTSSTADG